MKTFPPLLTLTAALTLVAAAFAATPAPNQLTAAEKADLVLFLRAL